MKSVIPSTLISKSHQARDAILEFVQSKLVHPGQKLSSERELAELLGINSRTVRRALGDLEEEGIIEKRSRVGNFVRDISRAIPVAVAFPSYLMKENQHHLVTGVILSGINDVLDQKRYTLTTISYRPAHFTEDAGQLVMARRIRGLLLAGNWQVRAEEVKQLMDQGIHIVMLSSHEALVNLGLPAFYSDGVAVLSQLMHGLIERGHRNLAIVRYSHPGAPAHTAVIQEACACHSLGSPESITLTIPNPHGVVDYGILDSLFERRPAPTAIIAPDEVVVGHLFRECYKRRIRVPEDLSIASCSDLTPDAHPVPLTSVDSVARGRQTASMAASHLQQMLNGDNPENLNIHVGGGLVWRQSVAPLSTRSPCTAT